MPLKPVLFQTIKNRCIECTDPFFLSLADELPDGALIDRLRQFGQTTPLLVWEEQPDSYLLLADCPMHRALSFLEVESVLCRILSPDTPAILRFSLQILHEQASFSQLSPIVQAHLLSQASQLLDRSTLLSLLPLMGHKPHSYLVEELTALLHLAPAAVRAIHRGLLASKAGKLIKQLSLADQTALIGLIETYRPGGSKQFKLVEMVVELCLRHNSSVESLLDQWQQKDRSQDNLPQQLQGLLQHLAALVWPEKTKMEKGFQRFADTISLPEGVVLVPSTSFEDESVEVRLRFADSNILQRKWEGIKTLVQS
ncbi:MAG: ParB/RepB/Spo0J family partition protein [Desulfobulbus sp.]|jgi:ParB family chromosome partitioning protein|uniref:hypothetical protein n=1 Tax=Desulfobulbus sp. TaxID=895 RepID=UPI002845A899|nr:hypothetical protein [Desulfobulbus sp.]MDR2550558.1 ParB/RepB/Spo0J family partition protein [Desulfobulbus sp.]